MPSLNEDLLNELVLSDRLVYFEADTAFKCRLAIYIVQWAFHTTKKKEEIFLTNPMNTLRARLLKSSLEKSAIDAYSETSEFVKKAGLEWRDFIGLEALRNHRHFQSHVYVGEFTNKQVKEFVEADSHFKDDIALRIWQVRSFLIQLQLQNGVEVKNPLQISICPELVDLVSEIFIISSKRGAIFSKQTIESTLRMFSLALTQKYSDLFNAEFAKIYAFRPI